MIWQHSRQHQQPNGVWDDGPIRELPVGNDFRLLAELAERKGQSTGSSHVKIYAVHVIFAKRIKSIIFFHLCQASTLAAVILNSTDIAGTECDKQVKKQYTSNK